MVSYYTSEWLNVFQNEALFQWRSSQTNLNKAYTLTELNVFIETQSWITHMQIQSHGNTGCHSQILH